MKLALSLNGTPIALPNDIQNINNKLQPFGQNIIAFGINVLLLGVVLVSFFIIIYAGIKWIMSSGDSKQIEGARNTFYYAIIGLTISFLSFLIVNVLSKFLNFSLIK